MENFAVRLLRGEQLREQLRGVRVDPELRRRDGRDVLLRGRDSILLGGAEPTRVALPHVRRRPVRAERGVLLELFLQKLRRAEIRARVEPLLLAQDLPTPPRVQAVEHVFDGLGQQARLRVVPYERMSGWS
jgi:hypothetical protein